jgi:hypothetical protein
MKLVWWMVGGSVLAAAALTLAPVSPRAIWLGMLGPLAAAVVSWLLMLGRYRKKPRGMTRLLVQAFAAKMVFFAIYVIVALGVTRVEPVPFAISFAGFYLALHGAEAAGLYRLQARGLRQADASLRGPLKNG